MIKAFEAAFGEAKSLTADNPAQQGRLDSMMASHKQFMAVARRCGAEILDGHSVAFTDRLLYALGNVLVYGPLRTVLAMSRIRVAYTAGAAGGPEPP